MRNVAPKWNDASELDYRDLYSTFNEIISRGYCIRYTIQRFRTKWTDSVLKLRNIFRYFNENKMCLICANGLYK